jgi:hypothetical protein
MLKAGMLMVIAMGILKMAVVEGETQQALVDKTLRQPDCKLSDGSTCLTVLREEKSPCEPFLLSVAWHGRGCRCLKTAS